MLHESAHKNTYLIEIKPKEYLCGDSAMKPPHNASPWLVPELPLGSRSRCPCGRPSGINSLAAFSVIYIYSF